MNVGVAEVDITPAFEVELCGFAARTQPSIGVLEPIYARALYLDGGAEKLLWIAVDVLALEGGFVEAFRAWATAELGLEARQVLLCATHTHSAPATIDLTAAGRRSEAFVALLMSRMQQAARRATAATHPCELRAGSAPLDLAHDRRNKPSAHVDPTVWAMSFISADGAHRAALVNYAMHPVALGHIERRISPDWCGPAASGLSMLLPGKPITLVTNGAAGNLNPPMHGVTPEELGQYGGAVASAATAALGAAKPRTTSLAVRRTLVPLPLESLDEAGIDGAADAFAASLAADHPWKQLVDRAADTWRAAMKRTTAAGGGRETPIEIQTIRLGDIFIVAVNGELFSRFTAELRRRTKADLFVVGYANAAFGYIPTRAAYPEGGYETDQAHFFYNSFRPRPGGLELLVDRAVDEVEQLRGE